MRSLFLAILTLSQFSYAIQDGIYESSTHAYELKAIVQTTWIAGVMQQHVTINQRKPVVKAISPDYVFLKSAVLYPNEGDMVLPHSTNSYRPNVQNDFISYKEAIPIKSSFTLVRSNKEEVAFYFIESLD